MIFLTQTQFGFEWWAAFLVNTLIRFVS